MFLDYLNGSEALKPFYQFDPTADQFAHAIEKRHFPAERRHVLADVLLEEAGEHRQRLQRVDPSAGQHAGVAKELDVEEARFTDLFRERVLDFIAG